jgi:hypothetical protein
MIASVGEFVRYFEGIRRRTWAVVDRVTPELIGWRPRPEEFSCGDIVRHLAGAERFFVTKVVEDRWTDDLDPGPALDHAGTRARLESVHREEMARLAGLADAALSRGLLDLEGRPAQAWRFLMAMVEHEVHHPEPARLAPGPRRPGAAAALRVPDGGGRRPGATGAPLPARVGPMLESEAPGRRGGAPGAGA